MGEPVEKEQILLCGKQDFLFLFLILAHTLSELRLRLLPFLFFSPKGAFSPNPAQEPGVELSHRAHVKHSRLPSTKKKEKFKVWVSSDASLTASEVSV